MTDNTYYLPHRRGFIPHSFKSLKSNRRHFTEANSSPRGMSTRTIMAADSGFDSRFIQHRSVRSNSGHISKHSTTLQRLSQAQTLASMNPFHKKRTPAGMEPIHSHYRDALQSPFTPGTKQKKKFVFPVKTEMPTESIAELLARKGVVPVVPVRSPTRTSGQLISHAEFQAEHREAIRAKPQQRLEDGYDPYLWGAAAQHSYKQSAGVWSGMSGSYASQESKAAVSFERGFGNKLTKIDMVYSNHSQILSRPVVPAEIHFEEQPQTIKLAIPARLQVVKVPGVQILGSKSLKFNSRSSGNDEVTFRGFRGSPQSKKDSNLIPVSEDVSMSSSKNFAEETKTVDKYESMEHLISQDPEGLEPALQPSKSGHSTNLLFDYIPVQPTTLLNLEPVLRLDTKSPGAKTDKKPSPVKGPTVVAPNNSKLVSNTSNTPKHPLQRANTTTLSVTSAMRLGIVSPPARTKPVLGLKDSQPGPLHSTTKATKTHGNGAVLKKSTTLGAPQLEKVELKSAQNRPASPSLRGSRLLQSTSTGYRLTGNKTRDSEDNSGVVYDPKPQWLEDRTSSPSGSKPSPFLYTIPESKQPSFQTSAPMGATANSKGPSPKKKETGKTHSKLLYEFDSSDQEVQDLMVESFDVQQK